MAVSFQIWPDLVRFGQIWSRSSSQSQLSEPPRGPITGAALDPSKGGDWASVSWFQYYYIIL
jgi:hypothetical protein